MFEISGTDLVPEKQRLVKSIGGSMDAQFIILFISFISSLSTKTHKTRIVSFLLCSFAA